MTDIKATIAHLKTDDATKETINDILNELHDGYKPHEAMADEVLTALTRSIMDDDEDYLYELGDELYETLRGSDYYTETILQITKDLWADDPKEMLIARWRSEDDDNRYDKEPSKAEYDELYDIMDDEDAFEMFDNSSEYVEDSRWFYKITENFFAEMTNSLDEWKERLSLVFTPETHPECFI